MNERLEKATEEGIKLMHIKFLEDILQSLKNNELTVNDFKFKDLKEKRFKISIDIKYEEVGK